MTIDGIATSELQDSSGETLLVKGCDITDWLRQRGVLNYEHRGEDAAGANGEEVVGKITFAKKLFKRADCGDDERQRYYWDLVKKPYVYVQGRLYDGVGHRGAEALAKQIRDHVLHDEPVILRFSIEGYTVDQELQEHGNDLKETIAKKLALTVIPCNRSCVVGVVADPGGAPSSLGKFCKAEGGASHDGKLSKATTFTALPYSSWAPSLGKKEPAPEKGSEKSSPKKPANKPVPAQQDLDVGAAAAPSVSVGGGALTVLGKPVSTPSVLAPEFDDRNGVLHTPKGSFPLYLPNRDTPEMAAAYDNIMRDPGVEGYHGKAMRNWTRLNSLMRAGKLPEEVLMHSALFSQLSPNCLDADTEALTRRGWVRGFDLRMDDVILTKNPRTGVLEWQTPTDLKLYPDYEGPLVEFKSRSFHAVTTPDHRWLVTTGRGLVREKTSQTIGFSNDKIHRTGIYIGPEAHGLGVDEAELLGWFVTDGKVRPATGGPRSKRMVYLQQSPEANLAKCERIEKLVRRLDCDGDVTVSTPEPGRRLWKLGRRLSDLALRWCPDRTLNMELLLNLGPPQLARLREAMVLGDGDTWVRETGRAPKERLTTGRQEQADCYQTLLMMLGEASSLRWRDMSKYEPKSDKLKNIPKMTGCFLVGAQRRKFVRVERSHKRLYQGKVGVWCPIVPNTFFVARRSGHVFITGNTPVPMQELMYGHLVDSMKAKGVDARSPGFGESVVPDWLARDNPDTLPEHSRQYYDSLGSAIRLNDPKGLRAAAQGSLFAPPPREPGERRPGDVQRFMLGPSKGQNMAHYHQLHSVLKDLVARHRDDARSATQELMGHKVASELHEARRQRILGQSGTDIGPSAISVHGLAPKTARYALAMMGGGNVHVPDTHFVRGLFGLDKTRDAASIEHLKQVMWNPRNSHVLNAVDRYFGDHHPSASFMRSHPEFGRHVQGERAIFPAFWRHWLSIPAHERARGLPGWSFNEATDHTPYWDAVRPFMGRARKAAPDAAKVAWDTVGEHLQTRMAAGEGAALHHYFAELAPRLLAAARDRGAA